MCVWGGGWWAGPEQLGSGWGSALQEEGKGPFCWDLNQPISISVPPLHPSSPSSRSCSAELMLWLCLSWPQPCRHPSPQRARNVRGNYGGPENADFPQAG